MIDLAPNRKVPRTAEDKVKSYTNVLSHWFKRIGRDENGNPLYEAPTHAVINLLEDLKCADVYQFLTDNGFTYTKEGYGIQLQSYSLRTDLQQIIRNYLKY